MVAADGHRVGHVGDVALEATVDVEPAALGAGGLVSVVRPRLRLQERNQRHLPLNLLGVRAAVIGDEELVVAEEAGLDASGADHGHEDPEEVGGIDEKPREVLGEQKARARAAAGRHVLVKPLEVEERVWDPLSKPGRGVVRIGVREQHRRMTEAAVGDHAGGAAGGHVGLRADQAERHGVILMALRNRPVHAVAEVHLLPPCLAELPDRVEAGSLRLVRRFLGLGLVERLQPVVAPHRSCEAEAGFDFELTGIDGPVSMIVLPERPSSSATRGGSTWRWLSSRSPFVPISSAACSTVSSVTDGATTSAARDAPMRSVAASITAPTTRPRPRDGMAIPFVALRHERCKIRTTNGTSK